MHVGTLEQFLDRVRARDPQQPEFHQAVREVMESVWPFVDAHPDYADDGLLDRIVGGVGLRQLLPGPVGCRAGWRRVWLRADQLHPGGQRDCFLGRRCGLVHP